jgi:hypothetical protein
MNLAALLQCSIKTLSFTPPPPLAITVGTYYLPSSPLLSVFSVTSARSLQAFSATSIKNNGHLKVQSREIDPAEIRLIR